MNPTPSDEAAGPSPDRGAVDDGGEGAGPEVAVPAPRSGTHPLPRRTRGRRRSSDEPEPEPGRDPDGRPFERVDDEMLHRLLGGLRDI